MVEEVNIARTQFDVCEKLLDSAHLVLDVGYSSEVQKSELFEARINLQLIKYLMDGCICTRANDIVQEANELLDKVDRQFAASPEPLDLAS